jgi:hypothetical protein
LVYQGVQRKEAQVTPQALERPGVRKMIEARELTILDHQSQQMARDGEGCGPAADTRGHYPNAPSRQHGDRWRFRE